MTTFGERLEQAMALGNGATTDRQLLHAGLSAIFRAVGGSHTNFLTTQVFAVTRAVNRGATYGGIGIGIGQVDGQQFIVRVGVNCLEVVPTSGEIRR